MTDPAAEIAAMREVMEASKAFVHSRRKVSLTSRLNDAEKAEFHRMVDTIAALKRLEGGGQ